MTLKTKFRVMIAVSAAGLLAVAAFWIQGSNTPACFRKSCKKPRTWSKCSIPLSSSNTNWRAKERSLGSRRSERRLQPFGLCATKGDNYFWINDERPTMIMHPMKPELDGTDLTSLKRPFGKGRLC